jgi:hypothetical protein
MNKTARITDVILRLQDLLLKHGNLEVYSVNYHSDFVDVPLQVGNDKQILVENGKCLICGGDR